MATTLTPRQQEIQKLLDQDKTPAQIADALGIKVNGVYQQLRRMRDKGGAKKRPARGSTAAAKSSPGIKDTAAPLTPLATIRARKAEIEEEIGEFRAATAAANKAADQAGIAEQKVKAKHHEELERLVAAENALRGVTAAPAVKKTTNVVASAAAKATAKAAPRKRNGAKLAAAPDPATSAPDTHATDAAGNVAPDDDDGFSQADREATADFS